MPIAYDRMPTVAEVKAELKSNGIKGYSGKKKAELYEMIKMLPIASSRRLLGSRTPAAPAVIADSMRKYEEAKERAKAAFERLSEKKKAKEVVKKRTPLEAGTIEGYLERLTKLYLIEEGLATDDTVDRVLQKIEDKGDYPEYQEEAIETFGGHEDIASKIYKYLIKYGRSRKYILNAMREAKEEGFTMFDDIISEKSNEVHISQKSKKAETLAAIKSQIVDEYKKLSKKEQDALVKRLPGYSNEYEEGHLDKGLEDYLNNHIYSGSYYPYRAVQKLIAKYINERSDDVVTYSPKFRVSRKVQDEIMRMLLGKHHVTMEEIDPSYYTKPRTKEENVLLE